MLIGGNDISNDVITLGPQRRPGELARRLRTVEKSWPVVKGATIHCSFYPPPPPLVIGQSSFKQNIDLIYKNRSGPSCSKLG